MSGGKETPRQKMIGMMYLVLTALLALNISKEVLDAFILVDEGLVETRGNFEAKNNAVYATFDSEMGKNPTKTKPYFDKAQAAKKLADELVAEIEAIKVEIVERSGGWDENALEEGRNIPEAKDDTNIPAQILLLEGKGKVLQDKIIAARKKFIEFIEERDKETFKITLNAEDPPPHPELGTQTWTSFYFEHIPLAAVITQMTKVQIDVRNAEADITTYLLSAISATDFKFDKLEAKIIAPTSYILQGQEYKADVFVSAFSSTQDPEIIIGELDEEGKLIGEGTPLDSISGGVGKYSVRGTTEGIIKWGGIIKVSDPTGGVKEYPFSGEYQVAKPSASVSPDKMNVLYIGVDNPLTISAPGFPKEKVTARMVPPNGKFSGSKGKFIANPKKTGTIKIAVVAELDDGSKKTMGEFEFRVKRIPDPVAVVAKMSGGTVARGIMKVQQGIFAELKDFNFDLRFLITKFNMYYIPKRGDTRLIQGKSSVFSSEVKGIMRQLKPGDKVLFDEVFAKGPDGKNRKLNGIFFTVK